MKKPHTDTVGRNEYKWHLEKVKAKQAKINFLQDLIIAWEQDGGYHANREYVRKARKRLHQAKVQLSAMCG